jgi:hypothetical protein
MEERLDILCQMRVYGGVLTSNVNGGNYPIFGQLPHVKLVHVKNPVYLFKQTHNSNRLETPKVDFILMSMNRSAAFCIYSAAKGKSLF